MTPEQWKRAKLVLEGARRHSPADRSQYVSVACADDPELLKEVESLLDLSSTPPSRKDIDPSGPALTQWEHLTILAEVGRGAFGRVYRAWDPALQMEVALKLIRVDTREPDFAESVFHEARLLVKVRHPNVVTVLGARRVGPDVGIWMEFINGPTLADAVERDGPMGAVEAAGAGIAVCDALAAVHGAGLLHRDIKARNVMRDASGRVVLMDFGAGADRRQQPHGEMAGTPLYMAPEVLKGAGASVASDIYSVGVLLFHLTTGEYPVTGHNIYELEAAHDSDTRARLADRRPDLPDVFVDAIDRAMSPDPAYRFRRAVEFREALSQAMAAITAPVAVPPRPARWPWVVGLGLVGALLVVTLLGFLTSAAFNTILGRRSPFGDETPASWLLWGIRAAFAPALYMALMFLISVLIRWLALLAATLARRLRRGRGRPRDAGGPRRSLNTNTMVRIVGGTGIVAVVAIFWGFFDILNAMTTYIDAQGAAVGAPFAPGNANERVFYRRSLELTMLVVVVALYRAIRTKRLSGVALDPAATATCVAVFIVALLMTIVPYRVMLWNTFPRAQYEGMRCYVLGESGPDVLLHCPESTAPHNQTVSKTSAVADGRLRLEGFVESIFIPAEQAAPPAR